MEWEKFSLENKELFNKYLNNYMGISDFTFTNFFIWSGNREISFYEEDESLGCNQNKAADKWCKIKTCCKQNGYKSCAKYK